jgi:hypothetical protein
MAVDTHVRGRTDLHMEVRTSVLDGELEQLVQI